MGRALDLGCAKGDDAVWLTRQGWQVTAVDVSPTVLEYARQNARVCDLQGQISFEQHDLSESFPSGEFDLVSAVFFESPVTFPRSAVLRRAADCVAGNGLIIIATHGSRAPWSWAPEDTVFSTAEEQLQALDLDMRYWQQVFVGPSPRHATGPNGQTATVTDNLVILEKR